MRRQHELPIPPAACDDINARELIRVFGAFGKQHIALATGLWEDPGTWGIMLVDLARHLAHAYELTKGLDPNEVLSRIREIFDAEWSKDTDPDRIGGLHLDSE